jgi:hypothetical protein
MGLDMYLYKKTYIGAEYEWRGMRGTVEIFQKDVKLPIDFGRISYIEEEAAYWRKANAIHRWFVDNCQDGEDECQTTYVDREQLEELLSICKQVKEAPDRAEELLPTFSGFFFGPTEYDEFYMEDIDYTIERLTAILAEEQVGDVSYYYHSSW